MRVPMKELVITYVGVDMLFVKKKLKKQNF